MECKNTKDIKCIKLLGAGASSSVYKIKYKNKLAALKKNKNEKEVVRELEILKKINDSCKTKNVICLVDQKEGDIILEFNKGVDMFDYYKVQKTKKKNLTNTTILFIKELKKAIEYIHSKKIIHFDIKPENILVTHKSLKLIDYGGSVIYKNKPIDQILYTDAYSSSYKFKNLSFAESKYKDWFAFFRTFRNDIIGVVSPLVYCCKDTELYDLFDTEGITIQNYKKKLKTIFSKICS